MRNLARQREGKRERVISDFVDAIIRDVANRDTAFTGSLQVDAVDADAVAHDDLAVLESRDQFAADGGPLYEQRIGIAAERDQLCGRLKLRNDKFVTGGSEERSLLIDRRKAMVGENNFHWGKILRYKNSF